MTSSKQKGNIAPFLLVLTVLILAGLIGIGILYMLPDGIKSGRYNNPNIASTIIQGSIYDRNGRALSMQIPENDAYRRTYPCSFHASQLIHEAETVLANYINPRPGFNEAVTYGKDVYLTIDFDIQYVLDIATQMIFTQQKCNSAVGLIADAVTGEVLAVSTYPYYDLNSTKNVGKNKALLSSLKIGENSVNTSVISKITDSDGNTIYQNDHYTSFGFTTDVDSTLTLLDAENALYKVVPSLENPKYVIFIGAQNPQIPETDSEIINLIIDGLSNQKS